MTDPTDLIVQATFLGADDKRFAAEKKRKRAPRVELPAIPDGPCCARCANWKPDTDPDDFGVCLALATVAERVTFGPERGTVVSIEQAIQQADWAFDYLSTRGFFAGCRLFAAKN